MSAGKHSPAPWKFDGDVCNTSPEFRDREAPWLIAADDKGVILDGDIRGRRQEDIDFLLLAVNLHDDLVEALKRLRAVADAGECMGDEDVFVAWFDELEKAKAEADAVLARTGETK